MVYVRLFNVCTYTHLKTYSMYRTKWILSLCCLFSFARTNAQMLVICNNTPYDIDYCLRGEDSQDGVAAYYIGFVNPNSVTVYSKPGRIAWEYTGKFKTYYSGKYPADKYMAFAVMGAFGPGRFVGEGPHIRQFESAYPKYGGQVRYDWYSDEKNNVRVTIGKGMW